MNVQGWRPSDELGGANCQCSHSTQPKVDRCDIECPSCDNLKAVLRTKLAEWRTGLFPHLEAFVDQ